MDDYLTGEPMTYDRWQSIPDGVRMGSALLYCHRPQNAALAMAQRDWLLGLMRGHWDFDAEDETLWLGLTTDRRDVTQELVNKFRAERAGS